MYQPGCRRRVEETSEFPDHLLSKQHPVWGLACWP